VREPEVLSLEEVRAIAAGTHAQPGTWNWQEVASLCATVEHWHQETCRRDNRAREWQESAQTFHDAGARLSTLVGRMREALPLFAYEVDHNSVLVCRDCGAPRRGTHKPDCELGLLLTDPDGQHAAEEYAKLREHAEAWRTLMSEAAEHLKEPEHAALLEKAERAVEEDAEERRLLLALESAYADRVAGQQHPDPVVRERLFTQEIDAWAALCLFREARQ
jgi:hypothetical protein